MLSPHIAGENISIPHHRIMFAPMAKSRPEQTATHPATGTQDGPARPQPAWAPEADRPDDWRIRDLEERPGFLIRRLHQIHVALFTEECAAENITPVQYSVLTALDQLGAAEQIALSRAVGLDRTNIADVVARLEARSLLSRTISPSDKRRKLVGLTQTGRLLLERVQAGAARAHERTIAALPSEERRKFLESLRKLVTANNDVSRSPVGGLSKS